MGKRRKAIKMKAAPTERNKPLATQFNCLFCNHENSVVIKLDKKANVGTAKCNVCANEFQTSINYLSAPVDVMSDWVDAADELKKDAESRDHGDRRAGGGMMMSRGGGGGDPHSPGGIMERPREDFIVDDEGVEDDEFAMDD